MNIRISELNDNGLQIRCEMNSELVAEYAELMKEGNAFPPVTVYREGDRLTLTDGFHRVAAAKSIGRDTIDAAVVDGTFRDALVSALGANDRHGLRRTNADKRHALEMAWENRAILFGDKEPSSRELAKITGVTGPTANAFIAQVLNFNTPSVSEETYMEDGNLDEIPEVEENKNVPRMLQHGKDRFGVDIPENILPVFRSREVRKLFREVKKIRGAVQTSFDEGNVAFAAVSQQVLINLDNAASCLKFGAPYCVCRACRGAGCYRCNRRGFQTLMQYKALPSEFKFQD